MRNAVLIPYFYTSLINTALYVEAAQIICTAEHKWACKAGQNRGTLGSSWSLHLDGCGRPWHHARLHTVEWTGAWGQGTRHLWEATRPAVTHNHQSIQEPPPASAVWTSLSSLTWKYHCHQSLCTAHISLQLSGSEGECRSVLGLECSTLKVPPFAGAEKHTAGLSKVQTAPLHQQQSVPLPQLKASPRHPLENMQKKKKKRNCVITFAVTTNQKPHHNPPSSPTTLKKKTNIYQLLIQSI